MKNVTNYNDFLINKIFEEMDLKIAELEMVLSPRFIKILKEMDHKIADKLLEVHMGAETKYKQTFIDLGSSPEMVTFIQSNKVADLVEPDVVHGDYVREEDSEGNYTGGYFDIVPMSKNSSLPDIFHLPDLHDEPFKSKDHPVWNKNRVPMKIGRFINRVFPKEFPANKTRAELSADVKAEDVESFTNMFIATVAKHSKQFEVVSGDQIQHYYNCDNYFKTTGTLGGSCMSSGSKGSFFDIYTKNADKVSMLVLYPEDVKDKIIGRALIWKLDEPDGRFYMERVYTADDSDEYMFINYAKEKGYLYKSNQTYGYNYDIVDPKSNTTKKVRMAVTLKPVDHEYYPYTDTMQLYDPETGLITNDVDAARENGNNIKQLTNDGGSYHSFD